MEITIDYAKRRLNDSTVQCLMALGDMAPGESRVRHAFMEASPVQQAQLEDAAVMALNRAALGVGAGAPLTLHKSAAIVRQPGADLVAWHSDFCGDFPLPPRNTGEVLLRRSAHSCSVVATTRASPQVHTHWHPRTPACRVATRSPAVPILAPHRSGALQRPCPDRDLVLPEWQLTHARRPLRARRLAPPRLARPRFGLWHL
jgi:hypothetical protein